MLVKVRNDDPSRLSGTEQTVMNWLKSWSGPHAVPGIAVLQVQDADVVVWTPQTCVVIGVRGFAERVTGTLTCAEDEAWTVDGKPAPIDGVDGKPAPVDAADNPLERVRRQTVELARQLRSAPGREHVPVSGLVLLLPQLGSRVKLEKGALPPGIDVLIGDGPSSLRAYFTKIAEGADPSWDAGQVGQALGALGFAAAATYSDLVSEGFPVPESARSAPPPMSAAPTVVVPSVPVQPLAPPTPPAGVGDPGSADPRSASAQGGSGRSGGTDTDPNRPGSTQQSSGRSGGKGRTAAAAVAGAATAAAAAAAYRAVTGSSDNPGGSGASGPSHPSGPGNQGGPGSQGGQGSPSGPGSQGGQGSPSGPGFQGGPGSQGTPAYGGPGSGSPSGPGSPSGAGSPGTQPAGTYLPPGSPQPTPSPSSWSNQGPQPTGPGPSGWSVAPPGSGSSPRPARTGGLAALGGLFGRRKQPQVTQSDPRAAYSGGQAQPAAPGFPVWRDQGDQRAAARDMRRTRRRRDFPIIGAIVVVFLILLVAVMCTGRSGTSDEDKQQRPAPTTVQKATPSKTADPTIPRTTIAPACYPLDPNCPPPGNRPPFG